MIGLARLVVYNSIFSRTEENNKVELHTDTFDELSLIELKDELDEIPNISNTTDNHSEDETIGPRIFEAYQKLHSERVSTAGYIIL